MRYRGKEFTGKGVAVAIIDSGIDRNDPRIQGSTVEGWSITLNATGHAILSPDYHDQNGHGTDIAAAVLRMAPEATIVAVKIMDDRLRTSADLMAAGIETAYRHGSQIINLSLGTPNMGKALLLRDCCAMAVESGTVVLAAAHPKGERAYPADLPETVGVASHPDCPLEKFYYFSPHRFPANEWGNFTDKFLTHGRQEVEGRPQGPFKGTGMATAYLSGRFACMAQALPGRPAEELIKIVGQLALTPVHEIGYA